MFVWPRPRGQRLPVGQARVTTSADARRRPVSGAAACARGRVYSKVLICTPRSRPRPAERVRAEAEPEIHLVCLATSISVARTRRPSSMSSNIVRRPAHTTGLADHAQPVRRAPPRVRPGAGAPPNKTDENARGVRGVRPGGAAREAPSSKPGSSSTDAGAGKPGPSGVLGTRKRAALGDLTNATRARENALLAPDTKDEGASSKARPAARAPRTGTTARAAPAARPPAARRALRPRDAPEAMVIDEAPASPAGASGSDKENVYEDEEAERPDAHESKRTRTTAPAPAPGLWSACASTRARRGAPPPRPRTRSPCRCRRRPRATRAPRRSPSPRARHAGAARAAPPGGAPRAPHAPWCRCAAHAPRGAPCSRPPRPWYPGRAARSPERVLRWSSRPARRACACQARPRGRACPRPRLCWSCRACCWAPRGRRRRGARRAHRARFRPSCWGARLRPGAPAEERGALAVRGQQGLWCVRGDALYSTTCCSVAGCGRR